MRKIYIVGGANNYANWMQGTIVSTMEECDLVVFTGGEDITPSLYGENPHPTTYYNTTRDSREIKEFNKAVELGKNIIGICRGSQFCCVMSGGKLVQHQDNPSFYHYIDTFDNKTFQITSTHHQAQLPWNLPEEDYKLVAWTKGVSKFHKNGKDEEIPECTDKCEVEIVYYKKTKALCIQGHPEMMYEPNNPTIIWLQQLLNTIYKE